MEDIKAKVDLPRKAVERKRRIPLDGSERNILTIGKRDDRYIYRWVNKDEYRIERLKDAGYEFVAPDEVGNVGDRRVDSSPMTGSIVEKGVGGGKRQVLMKQLKEFYEEDQKSKHRKHEQLMESTKEQAKRNSDYGTLDIKTTNSERPPF